MRPESSGRFTGADGKDPCVVRVPSDRGAGRRSGGRLHVKIRRYRESDLAEVGRLIADTFRRFNLSYALPAEQEKLLGPFRHAHSKDEGHQRGIAATIRAPLVLVAEDEEDDAVVGVLRGSPGRLHSLFVREACHRRGIGRQLMNAFERQVREAGRDKITLQSTLYAVPFYLRLGYKRSTGVRSGACFDGIGFTYQPMKKRLQPTPRHPPGPQHA
jgi:GNAT superfamily N-acetyltransferase